MLALADLTADDPDSLATVEQLADQQGLPRKFLEAILRVQRRSGLVRTRRGAHGGYSLAAPASDITIGMTLRAADEPLAEVRGLRPHETSYLGAAEHLPTLWVAVRPAPRPRHHHPRAGSYRPALGAGPAPRRGTRRLGESLTLPTPGWTSSSM